MTCSIAETLACPSHIYSAPCSRDAYKSETTNPFASKAALPFLDNNMQLTLASVRPNVKDCGERERGFSFFADEISIHIDKLDNGSSFACNEPHCHDVPYRAWEAIDRNIVTWNRSIVGHVKEGNVGAAFNSFTEMLCKQIKPNRVTAIWVTKACSFAQSIELGRRIHACTIMYGLEWALFVANTLLDMYTKCGGLDDAILLFNRLHEQDTVSWNILLSTWPPGDVGRLYEKMRQVGVEPDRVTYICLLKASVDTLDLEQSWQVHCLVVESGLEYDVIVGGTLIDTYSKQGMLDHANVVFNRLPEKNVVMWSSLISGYVQQKLDQEALILFEEMQIEGINPNPITYTSIVKACSSLGCLEKGRYVYELYVKSGLALDTYMASSLVDMYVKCESLDDARAVFDNLSRKNIVAWSALIGGYAQHGEAQEALKLFHKMQGCGLEADEITFWYVLKACSTSAALEQGRGMHALIIEKGLEPDCFVGSMLIDMYGKLACTADATVVFERAPTKDVVTWSALIGSFGQNGHFASAHKYYRSMEEASIIPDEVTFLCLLSAYSRQGLVEEGNAIVNVMMVGYGIPPTHAHLNLLVDLYGNADHWKEAEDLLETMPFKDNSVGWISLLSSCRGRMQIDLGERCFSQVSNKGNSSAFSLLSNLYTQAGMQDDADQVDQLRRLANGWKKPGKASIEVDKQVHDFVVGNRTHPESSKIFSVLSSLTEGMKSDGYTPRVELVLGQVSEAKKEDTLCGHSEKMAMAFGLIHTPHGTTLRVSKNLRMCPDCHVFTKSLSRVKMREIIVLDAYRIHRFQNGLCSCDDR